MDRDIVNALHYLYQAGAMSWQKITSRLWCSPDSRPTVEAYAIIEGKDGDRVKLPDELIRFIKSVEDQLANLPKPDFVFSFPFSQKLREQGELRPCFVAMPYGPDWFGDVKETIVTAAKSTGFKPEVSIDLSVPGPITDQIWQGIREADVVIVDISGNNPNVFYELGLAHSLGKEVIIIAQDGKAPFDIRSSRYLLYNSKELSKLQDDLCDAFKSVTARYPFEGREPRF